MWGRLPIFKGAFLDGLSVLPHKGLEVAFVGRSNAGKSSLINALFNSKKVARVSQTPGCTKAIMLFEVTEKMHIVDLPGYGFNRQSKMVQKQWVEAINTYLRYRSALSNVFVLIDARRGLLSVDQTMLEYLWHYKVPNSLVLTKIDKVKPAELAKAQKSLKPVLGVKTTRDVYLKTSSLEKEGIEDLQALCVHYMSAMVEEV